MATRRTPTVLDAASLAVTAADDLVLGAVRDTHLACAQRMHRATRRALPGPWTSVPHVLHVGIATGIYDGLGRALRGAARGLDRVSDQGPDLEASRAGRVVSSTVGGLIGDKLRDERPRLAIPMAVRVRARDVRLDREGVSAAFPHAGADVVIFLHGLCEDDESWGYRRAEVGTTYPDALAGRGWTPVVLRANTGLSLRENGAALTGLLDELVGLWPVPIRRIALVGHSMGGLIMRTAAAVLDDSGQPAPWTELVTDVVTLGSPHLGSGVAWGVEHGSTGLGLFPETAAFERILEWRSVGVRDLVTGPAGHLALLPHARYHLVSASASRRPIAAGLGDWLVGPRSAHGVDRHGRTLFPEADVLNVPGAHHLALLNHPEVHRALDRWLATAIDRTA